MCEFSAMKYKVKSLSHGWIPGNEFTYEIMVINLNYSRSSFKFVSVRKNVLIIQNNHQPFFAVSSLHALRLLCGCCQCSVVTRLHCCNGRRLVLLTAEQGGRGGPCKHMMDVTGIKICWACLSARKETLETFKLRDCQRDQSQGHNPDWAIRFSEGFQAGEGRW